MVSTTLSAAYGLVLAGAHSSYLKHVRPEVCHNAASIKTVQACGIHMASSGMTMREPLEHETYRWALALALEASTKVVHDNVRAAAAKEDGVLATESTTSTRDHNRLAVISQLLRSHDLCICGFSRMRLRSRGVNATMKRFVECLSNKCRIQTSEGINKDPNMK
jgi:hypothetical protein